MFPVAEKKGITRGSEWCACAGPSIADSDDMMVTLLIFSIENIVQTNPPRVVNMGFEYLHAECISWIVSNATFFLHF